MISQLVEMQKRAGELARRDGEVDPDAFFMAEQNARLVKNAERYYRSMFESRVKAWNLRDQHMVETLNALVQYFGGSSAKIVVWAHNSHLGDARATQMGDSGESNISQLVREQYGKDAVLVGFTTYTGTVTAASNWDAPAERKRVRPAIEDSYESLFHPDSHPLFSIEPPWRRLALRSPEPDRARTSHRRHLFARIRAR